MSEQKNKLSFGREYAGSAGNVIKSVLLGKADAGAGFIEEPDREPESVRNQIRTILKTPKIAPHPLCAHPRVAKSVREAVRKAVLALGSEADGARILRQLRLASPVAADYEKDYKSLEEVDIKGLSNWAE